MKISRLFIFILVALFMVAGLSSTTAQSDISGTVNFYFLDDRPESRENWERIIAGFNVTYPNVTVNLIGGPATEGWDGYAQSAARAVAGGEQLDMIWVAVEGVQLLADLGAIQPLDEYIARDQEAVQDLLDDVDPSLIEPFIIDGQQYLLPYSWNSMLIYYNTARLEEAGLQPPPDDWTWDDFLEYAQALTEDTDGDGANDRYGYDIGMGPFGLSAWFASNNSASYLSPDLCAAQFNSPEVIETLEFLHSLVYEHQVSPTPGSVANLNEQFANGDVAMFGAGRWMVGLFMDMGFDDYDIAYWPGNPTSGTVVGVDGYAMMSSTQNPDATWEMIKYLTSEDVQQTLVGAADAPASNVPARQSAAEGLLNFPPEHAERFYGSLSFGNGAVMVPSPANFPEVNSVLDRYTTLIFANEMPVQEAMEAAQTELSSMSCG